MEKEEGWSSDGSDGGIPVAPVPAPGSKGRKGTDLQPRSKYSSGPWRPQEHRSQMGEQKRQLWEDPDKRPSKSSLSGKAPPFTSSSASLEDYMKKPTLSDAKSTKHEGHRAKAITPM